MPRPTTGFTTTNQGSPTSLDGFNDITVEQCEYRDEHETRFLKPNSSLRLGPPGYGTGYGAGEAEGHRISRQLCGEGDSEGKKEKGKCIIL